MTIRWHRNLFGALLFSISVFSMSLLAGKNDRNSRNNSVFDLYVTKGSVVEIEATDLSSSHTEFSKKPKVAAVLNEKAFPFKVLTKVSKKSPVSSVLAEWRGKVRLYDKKTMKGKQLSKYLQENPASDLQCEDFYAIDKNLGKEPVSINKTVYVVPPEITSVSNVPEKADDQFTVIGKYFGIKPPKVMIECLKGDKYFYKKCKPDKVNTLIFKDGKGKENKSCMKVLEDDGSDDQDVGYSVVSVYYPKLKTDVQVPTGYIIIDNGIGMVAYSFDQPPEFAGAQLAYSPDAGKVNLAWGEASDDNTSSENIVYSVYLGIENDVDTIYQDANLAATVTGETELSLSDLTKGSTSYFLVVATDEAGNISENRELISAEISETAVSLFQDTKNLDDIVSSTVTVASDESTVTFSGDYSESFTAGDAILVKIDDYYDLKKVDSVTVASGDTVLAVSDTALNEIIKEGELHSDVLLSSLETFSQDGVTNKNYPDRHFAKEYHRLRSNGNKVYIHPEGAFLIYEKALNENTRNGGRSGEATVTLSKGIIFDYGMDFDPILETDAKWSEGSVSQQLEELMIMFGGTFTLTGELGYAISGSASYTAEKEDIIKRGIKLRYFVGTVPVYQEVILSLNAKVEIKVDAKLSMSS